MRISRHFYHHAGAMRFTRRILILKDITHDFFTDSFIILDAPRRQLFIMPGLFHEFSDDTFDEAIDRDADIAHGHC